MKKKTKIITYILCLVAITIKFYVTFISLINYDENLI